MTQNCDKLVDAYLRWLRKNTSVTEIDGICEITTPFLDRHNDHLQIYVRRDNGTLVLTDDAYILNDLQLSGCNVDTPHRKQLLGSILAGFGVTRAGDELVARAQTSDFAQKKHALLQAMLAVNDLFATASTRVVSLFLEDVAQFLETQDVRFTEAVQFTGKSGFMHKFDFAIPASKSAPERLLRAINQPSKDAATSTIFSWTDIKDLRKVKARMYAVLNDSDRSVSTEVIEALRSYEIQPILWSHRLDYAPELAA